MRPIKYFLTHPKDLISAFLKKYGSFIPDKLYLKWQYFLIMGKKLNLKKPLLFTEKLQWLKLYDRNPEYTDLVDKIKVKQIVGEKIGFKHIIPTLGVWDNVEDINWSNLPEQFVLKTSHGGGGNGVVVCSSKSNFDIAYAKRKLTESLRSDIYKTQREWPYKNVPRKIFAEEYLTNQKTMDIPDYKWFCFNGEPVYCQVIRDRNTKETIDFFNIDWEHQDFVGLNPNCSNTKTKIPKPINLQTQINIAKELSKGFQFIRVDLYVINSDTFFGELTFYPASGFGNFTPEEWNEKLGSLLKIPEHKLTRGGGIYLDNRCLGKSKPSDNSILDYKFFCFNGKPKFLKVDYGRFTEHHANYYDLEWNLLEYGETGLEPDPNHIETMPDNFDLMVEIVKTLCKEFIFVRIDLYNVSGQIYFGELTLYPASGLLPWTNKQDDYKIGDFLTLPIDLC